MKKLENNYAFIDSQNLNLGMRELGWKLDYKKFRIFLKDNFGVEKAYLFIGYTAFNKKLYNKLEEVGFILQFRPTFPNKKGVLKGNIDADLILKAMIEIKNFNQSVIVSSDVDFYSLVEYLFNCYKFLIVVSVCRKKCSNLLWRSSHNRMCFIENFRNELEYSPGLTEKTTRKSGFS